LCSSSRQEAKSDIFDYIELFYNRQRKHESLGYHTPTAYDSIKRVAYLTVRESGSIQSDPDDDPDDPMTDDV